MAEDGRRPAARGGASGRRQAADFEQLEPERLDLREHAVERGPIGQRPGQHGVPATRLSLQGRERGAYRLAQAPADTDPVPVRRPVTVCTCHVLTTHPAGRPVGGAVIGWWIDECLIIVPRRDWAGLIERTFGAMSVLDDEGRELSRFLSAGAFEQDLDRQGRILLPAELREHAGLESRVKVVGAGEYLEVWDGDRLAERFAALRREGVSARAKRLADRVG